MQFMYCVLIDMKMMQDASTEALVEWRLKGEAPYDSISSVWSLIWRNYLMLSMESLG